MLMNYPILIPCGNKKRDYRTQAWDMYQGLYFKAILNYAIRLGTKVYIVSGGYGLLKLNDIIDPYDIKMNKKISNYLITKSEMKFDTVMSFLPYTYLKSIQADKVIQMYPKGIRMGSIIQYCRERSTEAVKIDLHKLENGQVRKLLEL